MEQISLISYGRDECRADKRRVCTIPDFYMIHFIESGNGFYNGIRLGSGQGFICMQNEVCNYIPDRKTPWTYTWINLRGKGADKLINSLALKDNTFVWNTVKSKRAFEKIWQYQGNKDLEELAALSAVYSIFAEQSVQKTVPKRDYVSETKNFFEGRFAEGVTVEDAAKAVNISRAYLRNVFFKSEGISPQGYLMKLRMNRAAELIRGDYSVTEIAAAVGYEDLLQFSKMFSKYFGISPTKFREVRLQENCHKTDLEKVNEKQDK